MKISNQLRILALCLYTLSAFGQNVIIKISNPIGFNVCDQANITVEIENKTNAVLNNVSFDLFLPQGINYIAGSISNASELNVSNQQNPKFSLTALAANAKVICSIGLYADCKAYDANNDAAKLANKLLVRYNNQIDSTISDPPYNLFNPFLLIEDVPNASIETGSTFTRTIKITNTRLGSLRNFRFNDSHDSAIINTTSGIILKNTLKELQLEFDSRHFLLIGDRDSLFERDEFIILTELISNKDCNPRLIKSVYTSEWGCSNSICQVSSKSSTLDFIKSTNLARLVPSTKIRPLECVCAPGGVEQELILVNRGGSDAENVFVSIYTPDFLTQATGFSRKNIFVEGNTKVDSIVVGNYVKNNLFCKDSFFTSIRVYFTQINTKEEVKIRFRFGTCLTQPKDSIDPLVWYYSYTYDTRCIGNSMQQSFGNKAIVQDVDLQSVGNLVYFQNAKSVYTAGEKLLLNHIVTLQRPTNSEFLWLRYIFPCPTILLQNNFLMDGKKPVRVDSFIAIDGKKIINVLYAPPFKQTTYTTNVLLYLTCDHPCLDSIPLANNKKFISSCPRPKGEPPGYLIGLCATAQLTCIDTACICGPGHLSGSIALFECEQSNEIDTIPAYVDYESECYRYNLGREDSNDDRFTNFNNPDQNLLDRNKYIIDDTMYNSFKGVVVKDVADAKLDSLVILVRSPISILPLFATINIYDKSSNKYYAGRIPIDTVAGLPKTVDCGEIVANPRNNAKGPAIKVTPEILNNYGIDIPKDFEFENGDSIFAEIFLKTIGSTGNKIFPALVTHFIFLYERGVKNQINFSCYTPSFPTLHATPGINLLQDIPKALICGDEIEFPLYSMAFDSSMLNFFNNEYRSILELNRLNIQPNSPLQGISINSVEITVYYQDIGNLRFVRKDTFPLLWNGSAYQFNASPSDSLFFDEAYKMDMRFLGHIEDCKKLFSGPKLDFICNFNFVKSNGNRFYVGTSYIDMLNEYTFSRILSIDRYSGSSKVEFKSKIITSSAKIIKWTAEIFNLQYNGSFEFNFRSKRGLLRNFKIKPGPGYTVNKLNDSIWQVTNVAKDVNHTLFFEAENYNCSEDTLCLNTFWFCTKEIPATRFTCDETSTNIIIRNKKPELELNVIQLSKPTNLCDTVPEYMLELYNANEGAAYNLFLDLNIPSGITLVPSSIFIEYAGSNGFIPLVFPDIIGANHYQWSFDKIIPNIVLDGLPGINEAPLNRIRIKFKVITSCDALINSYISFMTQGESNCAVASNEVFRSTDKIQIKGKSITKVNQLSNKVISNSVLNDVIEFEYELNSNGAFTSNDSIQIILPPNVKYVINSMSAIQGITKQEPAIRIIASQQILTWPLSSNNASKIIFRIRTFCWNNTNCSIQSVDGKTFYSDTAYCVTAMSSCRINALTSQNNIVIDRKCPTVGIDSFFVSAKSGDSTKLSLLIDPEYSNNFIGDSICVVLYSDSDQDGILTNADKKLSTIPRIYRNWNSGALNLISSTISNAAISSCRIYAIITPKTCVCRIDTAVLQLSELPSQEFNYSICSGSSISIGIDADVNYKYLWTPSNTICDTCSRFTYQSKITDSSTTKIFVLERTDRFGCPKKYVYTIKISENTIGKKTILDICKGETVMLQGPSTGKFVWRSSTFVDSINRKLSLAPTTDQNITLHYTDINNCIVVDTFCIIILDKTNSISISNDTTILLGDKANIWVRGVKNITWEPSTDVACASCPVTTAMPSHNTIYNANVIDSFDCPKTLQVKVIVVFPDCDTTNIFIPNAFSPNNDSHNDKLYVRAKNYDRIHWVIYNRWGEKVFEADDINTPWDGRYKGSELSPDVFGYCIEVYCFGGRKFIKKGNVSLLK